MYRDSIRVRDRRVHGSEHLEHDEREEQARSSTTSCACHGGAKRITGCIPRRGLEEVRNKACGRREEGPGEACSEDGGHEVCRSGGGDEDCGGEACCDEDCCSEDRGYEACSEDRGHEACRSGGGDEVRRQASAREEARRQARRGEEACDEGR